MHFAGDDVFLLCCSCKLVCIVKSALLLKMCWFVPLLPLWHRLFSLLHFTAKTAPDGSLEEVICQSYQVIILENFGVVDRIFNCRILINFY